MELDYVVVLRSKNGSGKGCGITTMDLTNSAGQDWLGSTRLWIERRTVD